jgi:hypothetical protein
MYSDTRFEATVVAPAVPEKLEVTQLIRAKALIQDPKNWTINVFARNADGYSVDALDPDAERFCANGALWKVIGSFNSSARQYLQKASLKGWSTDEPAQVNNDEGHEATLKMFDMAIEMARAA